MVKKRLYHGPELEVSMFRVSDKILTDSEPSYNPDLPSGTDSDPDGWENSIV